MHSLLMSLKAIERVCAQEKSNTQFNKNTSNKNKKRKKRPGTKATTRVPRKFALRSIATSARSMGAHILCTTQKIVISMRKLDWKKPISVLLRKAETNPNLQRTLLCNRIKSWKSLRLQSSNQASNWRKLQRV
jgi:hypothetical protein